MKESHKTTIKIIIFGLIFGLAGGLAGDFIARVYVFRDFYNIPFYGEINFTQNQKEPGLVFRDAKKVVVDQNTKINETLNSINGSLVGIFKKKKTPVPASGQGFNINNYYDLNQPLDQGIMITSDGWIVTSFQGDASVKNSTGVKLFNPTDYVVITKGRNIYEIDQVERDNLTSFNFVHVSARDFSPLQFADNEEIKAGVLTFAANWRGDCWLTSLSVTDSGGKAVFSSDNSLTELILVNNPPDNFKGTFLFNFKGDIMGLINDRREILPMNKFTGAIKSLLQYKKIVRASLGINYLDLSKLAAGEAAAKSLPDKGALIYGDSADAAIIKGSAAQSSGLKTGDVIVAIDNIDLNQDNNLADIIENHVAGDQINLVYRRGVDSKEVEIKLGVLK